MGALRETVVLSRCKKSRLFYTHNIFRKSYSFIALRMEKIREILWNSRFRVEAIIFLCFFFWLLTRVAHQAPLSMVAFSRVTSCRLHFGTSTFTIIERNIKAIFREYFSSLCFDSGKIFMMIIWIIFSCRPRTTYCIVFYFHLTLLQLNVVEKFTVQLKLLFFSYFQLFASSSQ